MSQLHKPPYGFLGALALKALGRTPDEVSDVLAPTLDLTDFYLADQLDVIPGTTTITAPATSGVVALQVPQGRAYRLLAYSVEITAAAGDTAIVSTPYVAINQGGGAGGTVYLPRVGAGLSTTGTGLRAFAEFGRRILLPAGFGLTGGFVLSAAPGTPMPVVFSILVQSFEN